MLFTTENLVVIAAIALVCPAIAGGTVALERVLRRPVPTTWIRVLGAASVSLVAVFWAFDKVLDRFTP